MKANRNKVILRYHKKDLEAKFKSAGGLWLPTVFDPGKHVCEIAQIEADNDQLNKDGLYKGDFVLVQYLVAYDEYGYEKDKAAKRNTNYLETFDNGDELRWCDFNQVYGKRTDDGFVPVSGMVFCELPPSKPEHQENGITVLEEFQDTMRSAYYTFVRYIHPKDEEETGLKQGDKVWAEKNSDAIKDVFGEKLIRVPLECILGLVEV